jgi:hypothetical protein
VGWLQDVLGVTSTDYMLHARQYVGTERALHTTFDLHETPLPNIARLHEVLDQVAVTDTRKATALSKYFVDMQAALYEMGRVVQPGHHIVLVVCPSHIRKIQIPTNDLLIEIAGQLPLPNNYTLRLHEQIERTLDDRRRLLPYMTEVFGPRMRTEYVIVLQKVPLESDRNARPLHRSGPPPEAT